MGGEGRGRWNLGSDFYFASAWDFIHFIMFGRTKGKGADLKPIKNWIYGNWYGDFFIK